MKANKSEIIIVIPALNEEKSISNLIKKCEAYSSKIIVLNDGSTDQTENYARDAGALVINHKKRLGVGAAVRNGYKYALKIAKPDDIIVNLDGDGQHFPSDIAKIIQPILSNRADLVIGSRFLGVKGFGRSPIIRTLGNKIFSLLISIIIRQKITDAQSGFRAIRARKLKLIELKNNFTNRQEMILLANQNRLNIKEISIKVDIRKFGKSFLGTIINKIKFFLNVIKEILKHIFHNLLN